MADTLEKEGDFVQIDGKWLKKGSHEEKRASLADKRIHLGGTTAAASKRGSLVNKVRTESVVEAPTTTTGGGYVQVDGKWVEEDSFKAKRASVSQATIHLGGTTKDAAKRGSIAGRPNFTAEMTAQLSEKATKGGGEAKAAVGPRASYVNVDGKWVAPDSHEAKKAAKEEMQIHMGGTVKEAQKRGSVLAAVPDSTRKSILGGGVRRSLLESGGRGSLVGDLEKKPDTGGYIQLDGKWVAEDSHQAKRASLAANAVTLGGTVKEAAAKRASVSAGA